ncbi:MAG: response regulator transcription factor [Actinobacteria bacterium]|nr:response regulator transcription factor [Actinomycetota bacterium]MBU1865337.1 response regulator transcription factor [Actinomycetota bacterium]
MTRILIADDDALVRMGLRVVIEGEPDFEVVGEAEDGRQAIELVREQKPDLVIMDIRMPHLDGLAATREITAGEGGPKVLVLTTFELDEYVYEALRAGAAGFVLKRVPPADLIEAVRVVASGDSMVYPAATRRLVERFASPSVSKEQARALASLSEREQEVLRLLAQGHNNREMSEQLFVGMETVKSHVGAVLLKLGVRDRTQAVITAYESGFVRPGEA